MPLGVVLVKQKRSQQRTSAKLKARLIINEARVWPKLGDLRGILRIYLLPVSIGVALASTVSQSIPGWIW